ncbi:MAG: hypothetical protein J6X62_06710 [Bacteroidales bacterium]|nr:hypothetical protein [Bacteroidales bacterium]
MTYSIDIKFLRRVAAAVLCLAVLSAQAVGQEGGDGKAAAQVGTMSLHKANTPHTYLMFNVAGNVAPQLSAGVTLGSVKRNGWYVTAMTGFNFDKGTVVAEPDGTMATVYGDVAEGVVGTQQPFYTGEVSRQRLSLVAGYSRRINKSLWLNVGLGYGERTLSWLTANDVWVVQPGASHSGLAVDLGGTLCVKERLVLGLGVTSIGVDYADVHFGIGFTLKKRDKATPSLPEG